MSASTTLSAPHISTTVQANGPSRYSLAPVMAMPIAFAVILILTRLAAG